MFHTSKTRICYVYGARLSHSDIGDLVEIKNKSIYIKSRHNQSSVKINGKLSDLTYFEKVSNSDKFTIAIFKIKKYLKYICKSLDCVENIFPIVSDEFLFLVTIVDKNTLKVET